MRIGKLILAADKLSQTSGKLRTSRRVGYVDFGKLMAAFDHMEAAKAAA
ncbi:hypothetical protein [Sphingorhabdus sp. EL138]|nr:hypothetical protein [Sphingorhabdus sp. EL138]